MVESGRDRNSVRADDRDVHDVPDPGDGSGSHELAALVVVALRGAREVDHDGGPTHGRQDTVASAEIGRDVRDASDVLMFTPPSAEDTDVVAGIT
jgi:hypothetical protein